MPEEILSNLYLNYGVLGLIIAGFFGLLIWTIRRNATREDKLYSVVETLSQELPQIRSSLSSIEDKIKTL